MSDPRLLAAGGRVRGRQVYGTSDRIGASPADKRVGPEYIDRTVLHAMDIDDLHANDRDGRPFHRREEGRPLTELLTMVLEPSRVPFSPDEDE